MQTKIPRYWSVILLCIFAIFLNACKSTRASAEATNTPSSNTQTNTQANTQANNTEAFMSTSSHNDNSTQTKNDNRQQAKQEKTNGIDPKKIDTSNWKTFGIGRYLIDLPPNAKITWLPLKFQGEYELKVVNISLEEAKKLIKEEAEIAKNTPHEDFENCFVQEFYKMRPRGNSSALVKRANSTWDGYAMKVYFETNTNSYNEKLNKILYYENEVFDTPESIKNGRTFIDHLVNYTLAFDEATTPFMRKSGTHFEGGYLLGPHIGVPWPTEEIGAIITLPDYPGIELSLYFNHARRDIYTGIKKINAELAGRASYEEIRTFTVNGIKHYDFEIKTPSQKAQKTSEGETAARLTPYVRMTLENPIGGVVRDGVSTRKSPIRQASFTSDAQALGVWEALKEGLRWRPEGGTIYDTDDPDYDSKIPSAYFYVNKERVFVPYPPAGWEFKK